MEDRKFEEMMENYKALIKAMNTGGIPYHHKVCLTLDEAARYSGIGITKLREVCDSHPELNIWNGAKRLVKRAKLEKFIEEEYSL